MASQNGNGNGNGNGRAAPAFGVSEHGQIAFHGHGGRRPRMLAVGGMGEKYLTMDDRYLYWTEKEDGTVTRLPKDGGVPLVLATGQRRPDAITVAGGWVYWVNGGCADRGGSVVRMPAEGGDVEILEAEQEMPCSIAIFEDTIVWTTFGDGLATGEVMMKKLGGGPAVRLASKQKQPCSIAIDAHQIYWTNFGNKRPGYFIDGSVLRIPRDGGTKRYILAKDQSMPCSIVMDDASIYWTTAKMITEPFERGAILRRGKGEKKTTTAIVSWWLETGSLALDETHVYWLEEYGAAMYRVRKDGSDPEQMMAGNGDRMLRAQSVAVDDRCVYWTAWDSRTAGGAIFKMAK